LEFTYGSLYTAGLPYFGSLEVVLLLSAGVLVGIIFGVLPGLGTPMALAVFTPLTFGIGPVSAIVFLMGIYSGCVYGGAITGILINIPGTPSALATIIDGYPLARQGRAGEAIGIATMSSSLGGVFGALVLAFLAPLFARFTLLFGSGEYVALALLGLCMIAQISGRSILNGLIAGTLGLLLSTVGADVITAYPRFAFGSEYLQEGIPLVALIVGVFGIGEVLDRAAKSKIVVKHHLIPKLEKILPRLSSLKALIKTIIRSSFTGVLIGATPAAGGAIASVVAYGQAKRASKNPEKFGNGALEGVSAAESANNASTGGALIPLLTLGLPGDPMGPILLGALMLHGLSPGPLLFRENPEIVSAVFISMLLAAILLGLIGIALVPFFSKIIQIPDYLLMPIVIVLCTIGAFAMRNTLFDIGVLLAAGLVGFLLRRVDIPLPPLLLGFILGPMLEDNLSRLLLFSGGNVFVIFTRPLSAIILLLALIITFWGLFKKKG
jgi:putative tricarboxylic transport membrane protein